MKQRTRFLSHFFKRISSQGVNYHPIKFNPHNTLRSENIFLIYEPNNLYAHRSFFSPESNRRFDPSFRVRSRISTGDAQSKSCLSSLPTAVGSRYKTAGAHFRKSHHRHPPARTPWLRHPS